MVSAKNGNPSPPDQPDVYDLYVRYKADERSWFLSRPSVAESAVLRAVYEAWGVGESREEFLRRLDAMPADDRRRFEARLVAGYAAATAADAAAARGAAESAGAGAEAAVEALLGRPPGGRE